jgi:hypothetical protein
MKQLIEFVKEAEKGGTVSSLVDMVILHGFG